MACRIPEIDWRALSAEGKGCLEAVQGIGEAFQDLGCIVLTHHGIGRERFERIQRAAQAFFALSPEEKAGYERPSTGKLTGYLRLEGTYGAGALELWHIGRGESPRPEDSARYPANPWPEAIPDFAPSAMALYRLLDRISLRVLEAGAVALGLVPETFRARVEGGWSTLRLIGYPARLEPSLDAEGFPHADYTAITFFCGATDEGLQRQAKDGTWHPVSVESDRIVVGVGDILHRWTEGAYRAFVHRVVVPQGDRVRRIGTPFFVVPRPEVSVTRELSVARYLAEAIAIGVPETARSSSHSSQSSSSTPELSPA